MFCINCGTKLPDGASFCPNCGKNMKKILKSETSDKGAAFEGENASEKEGIKPKRTLNKSVNEEPGWDNYFPEQQKRNHKKIIIIAGIAVVVVVVVILALILSKGGAEDSKAGDDSNKAAASTGIVGESIMNKQWYSEIENEDDGYNEYYTFEFDDDGTLDFEYRKDSSFDAIIGDSIEYSFSETEDENVWILAYSGDFEYQDKSGSETESCYGRIECSYDESTETLSMVPLSGKIIYTFSRSEPLVLTEKSLDELSVDDEPDDEDKYEHEDDSQMQEPQLTQMEARSISNEIISEYLSAYISDFNNKTYSSLASVIESGSSFERSKRNWINQCDYYEQILSYDIQSTSIEDDDCIYVTTQETYHVYGDDESFEDYDITQQATYVLSKQDSGRWKISAYSGNVKTLDKTYDDRD